MTVTAFTGPVLSFGQTYTSTGGVTDYNPNAGPSVFFQSVAIMDGRPYATYQPGQPSSAPIYGWLGSDRVMTISQIPSTALENSIALTQSATTTTSRSIVLSSISNANVTINQSIVNALTGQTVTGLLAIDSKATPVTFGSDQTVNLYDPNDMISRCVRIEGSSDDSAGVFTINGFDVYGYPMTEVLGGPISTTAGSTFVVTRKAFKYISTITASGTINSTGITIGVADIFGFPLAVADQGQLTILISSGTSYGAAVPSTGVTLASTVATQTSTTPDVRGTWSSSAASDGVRKITVYVSPNPAALESSGLFGATQYSTYA